MSLLDIKVDDTLLTTLNRPKKPQVQSNIKLKDLLKDLREDKELTTSVIREPSLKDRIYALEEAVADIIISQSEV